jgi:hypothetical protein
MRRRALTVVAAVLAYFVGSLLWLRDQKGRVDAPVHAGSSLDASSRGLSLAFAYLARQPAGAERLRRAIGAGGVAADGTVFRFRPWLGLGRSTGRPKDSGRIWTGTPLLDEAEEGWVTGGGRLVLALDEAGAATAVERARGGEVRKVYPRWPGVDRLQPSVWRALAGPALVESHALFVAGPAPLVARLARGRGELILLAVPEILENDQLGQADHLALLAALAGGHRAYFDERGHGFLADAGLLDLLTGWGLGPLLVVLVLLGATAFWRAYSRLGPPDPDPPDVRREAVDLVDSLGALYHRSLAPVAALDLYRGWLKRAVGLRTGLRGRALDERVAELAGAPPRAPSATGTALGAPEFRARLKTLNDGFRRLTHAQPR